MPRRRRQHRLQLALFPDEAFAPMAVAAAPAALPPVVRPVTPVQPTPVVRLPLPRPVASRGLSSADARRMVWLRTQGEPVAAIAAQFHTSPRVVLRYLREPERIRKLEAQEARGRRANDGP